MLVLKRIRVTYILRPGEADRTVIERVHEAHHRHCPVYRSLEGAIEITTNVEVVG